MDFLGAGIGLIILKMPFHAGNYCLGHKIDPLLGIPAVGAGNMLVGTGNFNDGSNLRMKGIGMLVANAGITQIDIFAMGISYNRLILKLRMEKAASLLRQNHASVDAIASAVGYSTVSSFYRAFTKYFGCTPGNYVKKISAQ